MRLACRLALAAAPVLAETPAELEKLLATAAEPGIVMFEIARQYAIAGDRKQALDWMEKAAALNPEYDPEFYRGFETMAALPEFQPLVERARKASPPVRRSEIAFTVAENDLIPEGLAFDPRSGKLYLSSVNKRKIVEHEGGPADEHALGEQSQQPGRLRRLPLRSGHRPPGREIRNTHFLSLFPAEPPVRNAIDSPDACAYPRFKAVLDKSGQRDSIRTETRDRFSSHEAVGSSMDSQYVRNLNPMPLALSRSPNASTARKSPPYVFSITVSSAQSFSSSEASPAGLNCCPPATCPSRMDRTRSLSEAATTTQYS
jgi:hypothetical protein